jgi:hypothetical protein
MMLSRQNNFGWLTGWGTLAPQTVSFTEANTAGNGLIVVGYFLCMQSAMTPNLTASDSAGNSYISVGAIGRGQNQFPGWVCLLQIWYVPACKGGTNAVTVTETVPVQAPPDTVMSALGVSVLEYSSSLGTVDGSSFASGVGNSSAALTVSGARVGDLLFGYAANMGEVPTVAVDSSTPGYTVEQNVPISQIWAEGPVPLLAVDRVSYSTGVQRLVFDFTQVAIGLQTALLVAFSSGLPPPSPPPPSPTSPATPVLGPGEVWPTIF